MYLPVCSRCSSNPRWVERAWPVTDRLWTLWRWLSWPASTRSRVLRSWASTCALGGRHRSAGGLHLLSGRSSACWWQYGCVDDGRRDIRWWLASSWTPGWSEVLRNTARSRAHQRRPRGRRRLIQTRSDSTSAESRDHVRLSSTRKICPRKHSSTLSAPIALRLYAFPYWSNPPFFIYDIRALWRSRLSARVPECHK